MHKEMRLSLADLLSKSIDDRDAVTISTTAHWASYHLISAILDNLPIPENLKHRNHRSIKYILKNSPEIGTILGEKTLTLLNAYNEIENRFMSHFQYGGDEKVPDYDALITLLDEIVSVCKEIVLEQE